MTGSRHGSVAGATFASGLLLLAVIGTAAPAFAAPPSYRYQNREAGRGASLDNFVETSDGYRYTYFSASQYFDRAGTYEGADVYLYEETYGAETYSVRETACPVDRNALDISQTDATFAASIDTASCYFNFAYSIDLETGAETYGEGFSGTLAITGRWRDAAGEDSAQRHGRSTSPWDTFNYVCNFRAGYAHAIAEVLVDGAAWGSGGSGFVYRDDCNVLYKAK